MHAAFTPDNLMVLAGIFGPLLVAMITGLKTSSKVKSALAIVVIGIFTAIKVYLEGLSGNILTDAATIAIVWQTFYQLIWKPTNVAANLQQYVPLKIGEIPGDPDENDVVVALFEEDGVQDVVQDPVVTYEDEEVFDDGEPVEE